MIRVHPDDLERLDVAAQERGVPRAAFCLWAVKRALEDGPAPDSDRGEAVSNANRPPLGAVSNANHSEGENRGENTRAVSNANRPPLAPSPSDSPSPLPPRVEDISTKCTDSEELPGIEPPPPPEPKTRKGHGGNPTWERMRVAGSQAWGFRMRPITDREVHALQAEMTRLEMARDWERLEALWAQWVQVKAKRRGTFDQGRYWAAFTGDLAALADGAFQAPNRPRMIRPKASPPKPTDPPRVLKEVDY